MNTAAYTRVQVMLGGMEPGEDPFERAFRELEGKWGDPAAHKRFIAFCATQGALSEAGSRYRRVRDADPARREEATRQIDAVLAQAMQTMVLARSSPNPHAFRRRLSWVALAGCVCVGLFVLLRVLRARGH